MSAPYHPVQTNEKASTSDLDLESDDMNATTPPRPRYSTRRLLEIALFFLSLLINAYLLGYRSTPVTVSPPPNDHSNELSLSVDPGRLEPLYSPANVALKDEYRVFTKLGVKTPYNTPYDDETDKLWEDMYSMGIQKIDKHEAALLPNWTEPIEGDDEHYVVILHVFHQLHCLNYLRKALMPERYPNITRFGPPIPPDPTPFDHTDHCINTIRESLLCNPDITPDVYQWKEERQSIYLHLDTLHVCKSWDALTDWAKERQVLETWDAKGRKVHDHDAHLRL
ncbi:hypothetical protein SISNIDRAFT_260318 [Sistotremastrum niveocremeum HHB9708]|uniref:Tat pathway signal sequence n=2 Tax=Sistotremastraceae TaxID=3402574 RepID=A0A164P9N0_9AGAM|nr:hypothetical protein SISNIDRAFT_260318 [Sistotremastrum niveocremeum HHB9708]KZT32728.1 hypothetical protein SISSUDRAFT_489393 [Sistotremastrum suecicum HHB10207 ss-3]